MINKIILTLLCAAFFIGCAHRNEFSKKEKKAFYISVEKTACFGTCPIYKLEIENSQAMLDAKRFTDNVGMSLQPMPDKDYHALQDSCFKLDWASYDEEYLTGYSDLPSTIVRFSIHPKDTIEVRYEGSEAPAELIRLGNYLDIYQKKMQATWPAVLD